MSALQQETEAVRQILVDTAETLHPTLSEFIRSEIEDRQELLFARLVLAAAFPAQDSSERRNQRVNLAAALELLTVALTVHKLLLQSSDSRKGIDRSLAGGTVLAGDYCFSRAAVLAAQTGDPEVVAIFSELLQQLSEGNLRKVFREGTASKEQDEEQEVLYRQGALAGAVLAALPESTRLATAAFAVKIRRYSTNGHTPLKRLAAAHLADFQRDRWLELLKTLDC